MFIVRKSIYMLERQNTTEHYRISLG